MAIKVGTKAPPFTLEDDQGNKVSLKDFAGKKVILYFYPKDMTPGCTTEACDFRDSMSTWKRRKVAILGVSKDPVEKHQKFKEKYDLNFPLLADIDGKVCEKYGVWQEKNMYGRKSMGIVRSTFVIGEDGKIEEIYEKVRVKGHIDQLLETVK